MRSATIPYTWALRPLPPGVRVWPLIVGRVDRVDRPRHGGNWPFGVLNYVVRGELRHRGPKGETEIGSGPLYCSWPRVPYEIIHDRPKDPWQKVLNSVNTRANILYRFVFTV